MKKFIGRTEELQALQKKFDQPGFHMAVIYGRRRLGKTALINEFIRRNSNCKTISFAAVERSEPDLIQMLGNAVLAGLSPDLTGMMKFDSFDRIFDFIAAKAKNEKVIFVIDEYPYLSQQCRYMNSLLQKYVDHEWKETNLFFILCGSLVSFMRDEVLSRTAPLHGRSDLELKLRPFSYYETAQFVPAYSYKDKAVVYGLTGGVAKYLEQFDDTITLDENIMNEFFSGSGYFTEEQIKTVITGDKSSPVAYNSILAAIASGHTKYNEIATAAGMDDISYHLKTLQEADLIEKRVSSGKPYYVIREEMLIFWFKYVSPASSLINAGHGAMYYQNVVKKDLHNFMGRVFEEMAKQYLWRNLDSELVPYFVTDITEYQSSIRESTGEIIQVEIDLLGKNGKDIVFAGECKFRNQKFDRDDLDAFLAKTKYLPAETTGIFLFSLSGFTDYVKNRKGMYFISIKDMY